MQAPGQGAAPPPRKRLVVCCDGTWLDSDMGLQDRKIPVHSNVTRISQAIQSLSSEGFPQVVYYQAGIGTKGTLLSRIIGGVTAEGLSENIRSGYSFLANNYNSGDEIFLFGFSRGAYTVRSIAGLIGGIGLLTKAGLPFLAEVFTDYKNRWNSAYIPAYPKIPFPNKPLANDPDYAEELQRRRLSRLNIKIKAIGVWDTVGNGLHNYFLTRFGLRKANLGSLGIPRIGWLPMAGWTKSTKEMLFYDTSITDCIENAFQALALDESRASFSPAVWEKPRGNTTAWRSWFGNCARALPNADRLQNLRQVWFPGAHSNVGGGYDDQALADITLAWMISQLSPFIDFTPGYILDENEETVDYYRSKDEEPRPWSFGKIWKSLTGVYILGGRTIRTPGAYYKPDPDTGQPMPKPLRQTNEYIHASVRSRFLLGGPGIEDRGRYEATALRGYKLKTSSGDPSSERPVPIWVPRSRHNGASRLPESPLWETEKELLRTDPEMYEYLFEGPKRSNRDDPKRKG